MSQASPALVATNSLKYKVAAENPRALARVLKHVRYEDDCWIWTGATNPSGYAVGTSNSQLVYIHRLTHWIVRGPVESGFVLDHLCRNPSCVNPMHTEAVSTAENTRRGATAQKTHCPSGHPYDEANTRRWTDKFGYTRRYCITCMNARNAAARAARIGV